MTYTYDNVFGKLEIISDVQAGQYLHYYDKEGRLYTAVAPGGTISTGYTIETDLTYDDTGDGQLKRMYAQSGVPLCDTSATSSLGVFMIEPGWIFSDDLVHDGRGKVSKFTQPDPTPGHTIGTMRTFYSYSGMGTLKFADNDSVETSNPITCTGAGVPDPATYANPYNETFSDALGNSTFSQVQQVPDPAGEFAATDFRYDPSTLQLTKDTSSMGGAHLDAFTDTMTYNQGGDRTYLHRFNIFTHRNHWEASYYTADGKLYAVDRQSDDNIDYWVAGSRFEYKYDALGRRVQSYSRMDPSCTNAACRTNVVRSIWDGDRLLLEARYPADSAKYWDREAGLDTNSSKIVYGDFGRVLYTHGVALDEPEGMIRMDYGPGTFFGVPIRMSLFWNWRGLAVGGTFENGLRFRCHGDVWQAEADTACVDVGWSGDLSAWMRSHLVWNNASAAPKWEGSLIRQSADNSEQLYMRNRYYDPVQGRFTQEDPAGLAGGLNSYGFASGDPVNFSDPFGLKGCTLKDWSDCKILSGTAGYGTGIGVKAQLGPVEIKGDVGKVSTEASLTLNANLSVKPELNVSVTAFSGSVRLGSVEGEVSLGTCSTNGECTAASAGIKNVEGASNGDISAKLHVIGELGITLHAGEALTAFGGAASDLWNAAGAWFMGKFGPSDAADSGVHLHF